MHIRHLSHFRNLALAAAGVLAATSVSAVAHHPTGGATPISVFEGLASGLAHPVIGLDHLAVIIIVGIVGALAGRTLTVPAAFIGGTLAGCAMHLAAIGLPAVEPVIAISGVGLGLVVALQLRLSTPVVLAAVAMAGAFHGYAYGEGIFGAEPTSLGAYLIGFAAIQFAIAGTAAVLAARLLADGRRTELLRLAGAAVTGIGVAALWGHAVAAAFPGMAG